MENYLINTFRYAQRQVKSTLTGFANDSYCFDRWYLQHNAGSSNVQTRIWEAGDGSEPVDYPSGVGWFGQVKNNAGGAAGILLCQPVQADMSYALRNSHLRFNLSAIASTGAPTCKISVFEWSGTVNDASAKDLVDSWSSNAPVFNTTTLTQLSTSAYALNATTWADLTVNITASDDVNNFVVALWFEALSAGASIYLAKPTFGKGIITDLAARHDELELIRRFYRKSYGLAVAPGTASSTPGLVQIAGGASGADDVRTTVFLDHPMRTAPTVTLYDKAGNSGKISTVNDTSFTDNVSASVGVANESESSFTVAHGDTDISGISFHWTASAEL